MAVVQEGMKPLPHCEFCRMHIPAGSLIKNLQTAQCDRNTHMRWQRWDVEIAAKCTGKTLSQTGEDGAYCFEGVDSFKYLVCVLHRLDDDWPAFCWNIWR